MNIAEIKDLMSQFDHSSLREFSYRNKNDELTFSKNDTVQVGAASAVNLEATTESKVAAAPLPSQAQEEAVESASPTSLVAETEGDIVESPLVGVAYLSPAPDAPAFVSVGDQVKKGDTLLIIEAMKVMNEIPAPKDGVITEILVANEEVVEFGKGLVGIK